MEITGTVKQILEIQQGEGRNGTWRKQTFIVETQDKYPKPVAITVWGDKIDEFRLRENEQVTVSVNVESREYRGNWYTDVKAWKIDRQGNMPPPSPAPAPAGNNDAFSMDDDGEDPLPF